LVMRIKKVVVLYGGVSSERSISLKTGRAIYKALLKKGYRAKCIDAVGKWYERVIREKPDIVFIALHGKYGEDGRVQGLLDVFGIKYTGSGVLASALSMNKLKSREIFKANGLPVPDYYVIERSDEAKIKFIPCVVKPVDEGSTIGVSIVKKRKDFRKAVEEALKYSDKVIVERYIKGREFTVGILGDEALPCMEIIPKNEYYDYEAKYVKGMSEHICPAPISEEEEKRVKELALKAHKLLGCKAFSRVDFIKGKRDFYILEVNSIPGMTETSLLPEAAKVVGIDFPELVERIIKYSL